MTMKLKPQSRLDLLAKRAVMKEPTTAFGIQYPTRGGEQLSLRPANKHRHRIAVWSSSTHWCTIRKRCTSGMTMH
jgi:hypothetical protein